MTTSQVTPFLAEILGTAQIPTKQLIYFRARLKMRIHTMIKNRFRDLQRTRDFSKARFAKRLGKRPEQITRWINSPGNLTVDTISDLLLAMGYEPTIGVSALADGAVAPSEELWIQPRESVETSRSLASAEVPLQHSALDRLNPEPERTDAPFWSRPRNVGNRGALKAMEIRQ